MDENELANLAQRGIQEADARTIEARRQRDEVAATRERERDSFDRRLRIVRQQRRDLIERVQHLEEQLAAGKDGQLAFLRAQVNDASDRAAAVQGVADHLRRCLGELHSTHKRVKRAERSKDKLIGRLIKERDAAVRDLEHTAGHVDQAAVIAAAVEEALRVERAGSISRDDLALLAHELSMPTDWPVTVSGLQLEIRKLIRYPRHVDAEEAVRVERASHVETAMRLAHNERARRHAEETRDALDRGKAQARSERDAARQRVSDLEFALAELTEALEDDPPARKGKARRGVRKALRAAQDVLNPFGPPLTGAGRTARYGSLYEFGTRAKPCTPPAIRPGHLTVVRPGAPIPIDVGDYLSLSIGGAQRTYRVDRLVLDPDGRAEIRVTREQP